MPQHSQVTERDADAASGSRVQVTPNRRPSVHVDGVWWPQSRQLEAELPILLSSLVGRLDRVVAVGYRYEDWTVTPAHTKVDDRTVDLLGFDGAAVASVILIGHDGSHLSLRLIAPETNEQDARRILDAAPDDGYAAAGPRTAATRFLADVADHLAEHEGLNDDERTAQIHRWCNEAAAQFETARIQSYVPILVEHIVYGQMFETRGEHARMASAG